MTKNDTFFKILFAIELALLPMTIFAYLFLPEWSMGLFVAGILLSKIWIELFKNRASRAHEIIDSVGDVLVLGTLLIFLTCNHHIHVALICFVLVFVVFFNLFKIFFFNKSMPDFIDAVDYCYMLFVVLTLISLTFVVFNALVANIALFAVLLTTVVSVGYKIYYSFRYTALKQNIINLFRHKK